MNGHAVLRFVVARYEVHKTIIEKGVDQRSLRCEMSSEILKVFIFH